MHYVIAGYTIVLSILFLYGVQLAWRRRTLNRAVDRVVRSRQQSGDPMTGAPEPMTGTPVGSRPVAVEPTPTES
jgi:hypothetical protein